jgi:hypothetical protein
MACAIWGFEEKYEKKEKKMEMEERGRRTVEVNKQNVCREREN